MWVDQIEEIKKVKIGSRKDFKKHNDLPIARIKRIMKSDEDVRMISAETPVMFAKACEMFILELTLRSKCYVESQAEKSALGKESIQLAIQNTPTFDFLVDL
jgi:nuclear transcription factor Y gamma